MRIPHRLRTGTPSQDRQAGSLHYPGPSVHASVSPQPYRSPRSPHVQVAGEDLVEVDPADRLGPKPHGELAREALVPRLVPEAPDVDDILDRIHDPVLPDAGSCVQVELDPAIPVRGGG